MKRLLKMSTLFGLALFLSLSPVLGQTTDSEGEEESNYTPTAAGVPSTDIFVGRLSLGDSPGVDEVVNFTDRDGYDNQPFFLPDGSAILYTSARSAEQTDIYRYELASGAITQVTDTPNSEYSATVLPDGRSFATIREAKGVQQLWKYGFDGEDQGVLFGDVQPVGYQAWGDSESIAVFVLGDENSPHTLRLIDGKTGKANVIVDNPGRSLHKIPGSHAISFVHKVSEEEWWIKSLDLDSGKIDDITETLPGAEDYAWTPDGSIIMGSGSALHRWSSSDGWETLADLSDLGVEGITRLSVSPTGDRIAIVGVRPAPGGSAGE